MNKSITNITTGLMALRDIAALEEIPINVYLDNSWIHVIVGFGTATQKKRSFYLQDMQCYLGEHDEIHGFVHEAIREIQEYQKKRSLGVMKQVYIIGSLSRGKDIENIAEYIRLNGDFDVKYVKRDPRNLDVLITECYDKIEAADVVIAVEKTSYIFGTGTLYEIEYAKRCKKPILYTDGNDLSTLFMRLCVIASQI